LKKDVPLALNGFNRDSCKEQQLTQKWFCRLVRCNRRSCFNCLALGIPICFSALGFQLWRILKKWAKIYKTTIKRAS
jgi:hypothetical protein